MHSTCVRRMVRRRWLSHGFLNEVARAPAHRFDRKFHVPPGRHNNDREVAVGSHNFRKKVKAFPARSGIPCVIQVDQSSIVGIGGKRLSSMGGRFSGIDAIPLRMQQ